MSKTNGCGVRTTKTRVLDRRRCVTETGDKQKLYNHLLDEARSMTMLRTKLALSISAISLAMAILWWAELLYRIWLFFTDYGMQRFENHTEDGYFVFVHFVLICFIIAGVTSVALVLKEKKSYCLGVLVPMALGILAWTTVMTMHRTGLLIGYDEWMAIRKGIQPAAGDSRHEDTAKSQ